MTEVLPTKIKRVFKRLKIGELSLVDEPCVPGSDILVIKARTPGLSGDDESPDNIGRDEGQRSPGGTQASETELIEKALAPFAGLVRQLEASSITVPDFITQGEAMVASLQEQAGASGELVEKSAAHEAVTIITESVVNLAELTAAYEVLKGRVTAAEAATAEATARAAAAEAEVQVQKNRADAAEATAAEAVAKAKAPLSQAEQDEAVLKTLPDHLREEVTKSREKAETDALNEEVTKAKKAGVTDPEAVGKAMRALRKADPAATEIVEKSLHAASATAAGADKLFKSYGASGAELAGEDPEAILKAKAEEIKKAKPELTAEAAFEQAMDQNPELYGQVIAKRRVGAAAVGQ